MKIATLTPICGHYFVNKYAMMKSLIFLLVVSWHFIVSTNAFSTSSPSKFQYGLRATLGAGGNNAAPAIMCEIDNVPLLDDIPDGFKRLFMVRHGEVINPVSGYGTHPIIDVPSLAWRAHTALYYIYIQHIISTHHI